MTNSESSAEGTPRGALSSWDVLVKGRPTVDKVLEFCDFNSAAMPFYTQQLIPATTVPQNKASTPGQKLLLYSFGKWA